ncbi:MAG: hypothetical protein K8R90_01210 [Candidatus Cloacimonetes bacterium]|nr:hypothetical protein [Candidatus Cloacimonadota bacterium]
MKKVILPLMLLFVAASLISLESAPSDVVGFVKVTCDVGFIAFALPFTQYDVAGVETTLLSDIVGPYMTGGLPFQSDKVWDMTNGDIATENLDGSFSGMQDFTLGHAYYMENKHAAFDLYFAGKSIDVLIDFGTMGMGFTAVGVKAAGEVPLDDLDLISAGFTGGLPFQSDKIWDMNDGSITTLSGAGVWAGFDHIIPGHAYYIEVKNSPFAWVYDPASRDSGENTLEASQVNNTRR